MAIVITGGTGSMGISLGRLLAAAGHRVVLLDTVTVPPGGDSGAGMQYVQADVRDMAAILDAFRTARAAVVVHLAATLGELNDRCPRTCVDVIAGGTLSVLEAARRSGVRRVVAASTWQVYDMAAARVAAEGAAARPLFLDESAASRPMGPYAIAKFTLEKLGEFYRQRHGLEFAAVRFACYYGARRATAGRLRGLPAALNGIILGAIRGQPVEAEADPDRPFDAIYVKDCAALLQAASLAPSLPHTVYNAGSGRPVTLRQVAAAAGHAFGRADVRFLPPERPHAPVVLSTDRSRSDLGYAPAFDLPAALQDFAGDLQETSRQNG